jgi:hypothetical protein
MVATTGQEPERADEPVKDSTYTRLAGLLQVGVSLMCATDYVVRIIMFLRGS